MTENCQFNLAHGAKLKQETRKKWKIEVDAW